MAEWRAAGTAPGGVKVQATGPRKRYPRRESVSIQAADRPQDRELSALDRVATTQITVFEAAMAPQVGASIVAFQYGLDARLISLLVGVGTMLSFLTLPFWSQAFAGV